MFNLIVRNHSNWYKLSDTTVIGPIATLEQVDTHAFYYRNRFFTDLYVEDIETGTRKPYKKERQL